MKITLSLQERTCKALLRLGFVEIEGTTEYKVFENMEDYINRYVFVLNSGMMRRSMTNNLFDSLLIKVPELWFLLYGTEDFWKKSND